jgi:hypothetical protein
LLTKHKIRGVTTPSHRRQEGVQVSPQSGSEAGCCKGGGRTIKRAANLRVGAGMRKQSQGAEPRRTGRSVYWKCGHVCHLITDCQLERAEKDCLRRIRPGTEKQDRDDAKQKASVPFHPTPSFTLSVSAKRSYDSLNAEASYVTRLRVLLPPPGCMLFLFIS